MARAPAAAAAMAAAVVPVLAVAVVPAAAADPADPADRVTAMGTADIMVTAIMATAGRGSIDPCGLSCGRNRARRSPISPALVRLPLTSAFSVYIATGTEESTGMVYQTDETGRVTGKVTLPYTATGLALHRNRDLVAALPRDGGKLLKIDTNGKVFTILERDTALLHPVRVAAVGDSDAVVVADDISNVVAATTIDGAKPTIYQHYNWAKITAGMSVAVTRDKHVIFGNDGTPGIYRFAGEEHAAAGKSSLPAFGGVAADPRSSRWAAAQDPNYIYIFDGQDMLKKTRLPPNKSLYRNGLLSFSPAWRVRGPAGQRQVGRRGQSLGLQHREGPVAEHLHLGQGGDDRFRGWSVDALERKLVQRLPDLLTPGSSDFRQGPGGSIARR